MERVTEALIHKNDPALSLKNLLQKSRYYRFFIPVLIVVFAKTLGAGLIYFAFSNNGFFSTPWLQLPWSPTEWFPTEHHQLYVFTAQDSGWYLGIARYGYHFNEELAPQFMPLFPMLIGLVDLLTGDIMLSGFIITMVFSVLWIPVFHSIAERYLDKKEALACTILTSMFPIIFLFTTIIYSEGLFLFTSLTTFYFHFKKRCLLSTFAAALSSLTKIFGVIVIIPILVDHLRSKRYSKIPITTLAILPLLIYSLYWYFIKGDFAYIVSSHYHPSWGQTGSLFEIFILQLKDVFSARPYESVVFSFLIFGSLYCFLILRTMEFDWRLGVYSWLLFIFIVLFGAVTSLPRYLAFIFPLWLNLRTKNMWVVLLTSVIMFGSSLILWRQFLALEWYIL